jgi:hypothetical protein
MEAGNVKRKERKGIKIRKHKLESKQEADWNEISLNLKKHDDKTAQE